MASKDQSFYNPKATNSVDFSSSYGSSSSSSFTEPIATSTPPDAYNVAGYSNSDEPNPTDSLGFQPYVEAMAAFLSNPATSTPLTVSIEGKWGSGKSSFMKQLQHKLAEDTNKQAPDSPLDPRLPSRSHVVWFNPWRHDKQEALWAAFALIVIKELRDQKTLRQRLTGDLRLFKARINGASGWLRLLAATAFWWITILVIAAVLINGYRAAHPTVLQLWTHLLTSSDKKLLIPTQIFQSPWSAKHWVVEALFAAVGFFFWWKHNLSNPLEMKLERFLNQPSYKGHVAFIEEFHTDFKRVLNAYIGSERLFVFIDDLDRCADDHVVDLLQATNLMIGSEGPVVFVIGMDREKVASLIAQKASGLLPFLPDADALPTNGATYGFNYLEKFIQIPFKVPTPSAPEMRRYIEQITNAIKQPDNEANREAARARLEVVKVELGTDAPLVAKLAMMCAPYLDRNPRRVKQFINVFRLQAYIVASVGLLDYTKGTRLPPGINFSAECITLEQLGKFIAISLRWPSFLSDFSSKTDLLTSLAAIAENPAAGKTLPPHLAHWQRNQPFLNLLNSGISENGIRYSMRNAPIEKLLDTSPLRVAQEPQPSVIFTPPQSNAIPDLSKNAIDSWKESAEHLNANQAQSQQSVVAPDNVA
jgi:hypothetical protein